MRTRQITRKKSIRPDWTSVSTEQEKQALQRDERAIVPNFDKRRLLRRLWPVSE